MHSAYIYICRIRKNGTAAAAAKWLQSCPTLYDPIDHSPPGSPVPGILQARTVEWVAISFSNVWKWKVKVKSSSRVRLFVTAWTAAHQAPPSIGFSRQEYWSGVPLPSLEKWYRWAYFQSRSRHVDMVNRGGHGGGISWESWIGMYTLPCVKSWLKAWETQLNALWWPREVGWGGEGRFRREGGYILHKGESLPCTAEGDITL